MGTRIAGCGLNGDIRVRFGDRFHDDGLGGDAQPMHHKYREFVAIRNRNAEPGEQFLIGGRWCFEEEDARRIALYQEAGGGGRSGDSVVEDRHEICRGRGSLFDEQVAELGEDLFAPCPECCRSDKKKD